jgi:two-component system sensor histidine kinase KdpD
MLAVTSGRPLTAQDRRVLAAVAVQTETVLEQQRLAAQAAAARPALEADRMRTALLAAVSHDLRTPLAGAKAAVSTLRQRDLALDGTDRRDLFDAAESCLDRLTGLVADLLDMSRLQAGAVAVFPRRIALDELVPPVLDRLASGPRGSGWRCLTTCRGHHRPGDARTGAGEPHYQRRPPFTHRAASHHHREPAQHPDTGARVEVRVIDHGPGIPGGRPRSRVRPLPASRRSATTPRASASVWPSPGGLTEALGGTPEPEETPGRPDHGDQLADQGVSVNSIPATAQEATR